MNRIFRRGSVTYRCMDCGKITRNTTGEENVGLCRTCMEVAESYNAMTDGEMTWAEFQNRIRQAGYRGKLFREAG